MPQGSETSQDGADLSGQRLTRRDYATLFVCSVLVFLIASPPFVIAGLWFDLSRPEPTSLQRAMLDLVPSIDAQISQLNAIVLPIFAVVIGLQARKSIGGWFFFIIVAICLAGVIASLMSSWLVSASAGATMLERESWLGPGDSETEFKAWAPKARAFFASSLQTFLTFISVLLGLKVAETK